jgi:hypothetical protein
VHVARSGTVTLWGEWHVAHAAWAGTVWSAGSDPLAWQVAHAGGFGMPPGPCGRWHVSQPFFNAPAVDAPAFDAPAFDASWGPPVLSAWQVAQVVLGRRSPL